ncbi:MAG TPA: class D beta-lactamase [Anaerolineales bacterium]|nr:class D beta-lactamase [Anaerolineales bacterium]
MIRHLHSLGISLLVLLVVSGCVENPSTALPLSTPAPTEAPSTEEIDLESYFDGFSGAFVLYDLEKDRYIRYHPEQCVERLLPASTFKIMNSLIGLETGVVVDENYVIRWDGTQYEIAAWNQDHTLRTAMQNSVVWYHQELARRVGKERIEQYIETVGYGNQDISGENGPFWLNGALRISPDEQVEFLKRLYQGDLPFSERSMSIVRDIIVLEKTDQYQLSGKTGSGLMDGLDVGWFVGFVEEENNVFFFAANILGRSPDADGPTAKQITLRILQDIELLP